MLKPELLEIIANGKNSGIEFKRDDIQPEQLAKQVAAMTNFQGGKLLLGVEDDGTISGVQREKLEEWAMDCMQDKIHPKILPFYEKIKLKEDKSVAIISFPQGTSKPYVVRDRGRKDIYIFVWVQLLAWQAVNNKLVCLSWAVYCILKQCLYKKLI